MLCKNIGLQSLLYLKKTQEHDNEVEKRRIQHEHRNSQGRAESLIQHKESKNYNSINQPIHYQGNLTEALFYRQSHKMRSLAKPVKLITQLQDKLLKLMGISQVAHFTTYKLFTYSAASAQMINQLKNKWKKQQKLSSLF